MLIIKILCLQLLSSGVAQCRNVQNCCNRASCIPLDWLLHCASFTAFHQTLYNPTTRWCTVPAPACTMRSRVRARACQPTMYTGSLLWGWCMSGIRTGSVSTASMKAPVKSLYSVHVSGTWLGDHYQRVAQKFHHNGRAPPPSQFCRA